MIPTTVYVNTALKNNFDGLGTLSDPHNNTIIVSGRTYTVGFLICTRSTKKKQTELKRDMTKSCVLSNRRMKAEKSFFVSIAKLK